MSILGRPQEADTGNLAAPQSSVPKGVHSNEAAPVAEEQPEPCSGDHDWQFQDDSFDHEFGTERVHYWQCANCEATRDMEPGDYHDHSDYDCPEAP